MAALTSDAGQNARVLARQPCSMRDPASPRKRERHRPGTPRMAIRSPSASRSGICFHSRLIREGNVALVRVEGGQIGDLPVAQFRRAPARR